MATAISNPSKDAKPNSYDEVPYTSHPFAQTHPDRLATIATLFGMQPAPVEECRVLELGCGSGGNLIPLAEQLPGSTFVGVDLSQVQVEKGRELVTRAGFENIELRHASITDVDESFGSFDYILCHGVFSWVPREVQQKILSISGSRLKPQGVAYISYNTYPGWHMRDMIRDMMCFHTAPYREPQSKITEARNLLDFMDRHADKQTAFGRMLHTEATILRQHADSYLFHEHLEDVNEPIYFFQFIRRAAEFQLQYLGETEMSSMWTGHLPAEVRTTLERVSTDLVHMEQYLDFVRNRMFRQTLLCRREIPLRRELRPSELPRFYVSSRLTPTDKDFDVGKPGPATFRHEQTGAQLMTENPLLKAVMEHLGKSWPANVRYQELFGHAWSRANGEGFCGTERFNRESESLGKRILEGYVTGLIELHVSPSRFAQKLSECPVASRLAQCQVANGDEWVTNLRHEMVRPGELGRQILPLLDGTRNRETLLNDLAKLMDDGKFVALERGIPRKDAIDARAKIEAELGSTVVHLARSALLLR